MTQLEMGMALVLGIVALIAVIALYKSVGLQDEWVSRHCDQVEIIGTLSSHVSDHDKALAELRKEITAVDVRTKNAKYWTKGIQGLESHIEELEKDWVDTTKRILERLDVPQGHRLRTLNEVDNEVARQKRRVDLLAQRFADVRRAWEGLPRSDEEETSGS